MRDRVRLSNGVEIDLVVKDGRYLGLGKISVAGVELRSSSRPMGVEIRNPNGVLVHHYSVTELMEDEKKALIRCSMARLDGGPMEFMLHTIRNRYNTADWTQEPKPLEGEFEVVLRPVSRRFGRTDFIGFSYQYRYLAPNLPIYKILDRGTWEVSGRAVGNEFWMRNGTTSSIVEFANLPDAYSTEWYLPGIHQPNIFQFFPLQSALQGFTFTAHKKGILVTWPTKVAHVRSLFEKKPGSDVIEHWHEHCADLSSNFETSEVEVLWAADPDTTRNQRFNLYEEVRSDFWTDLHHQIGMREERVQPYGVMEEWTIPDVESYRTKGVPKLCEAGVKTIMIPSFFQNNMNVWGLGNMCCTVDLKVAETVGEQSLANMCGEASRRGAIVEMWANTSLSSLSDIFSRKNDETDRIKFLPEKGSAIDRIHRDGDPWVRNLSGAVEADHYAPVFMVMNLRNQAVREYWNESWKYAHLKVGLEGAFFDSSFNLSSDKFHFVQSTSGRAGGATIDQTHLLGRHRPAVEPGQQVLSQYRAYLDLLVEMQSLGYAIAGEDIGVFGVGRSGPDIGMRLPSLPIWVETICEFNPHRIAAIGQDPDHVYFSGLAYRLMWYLFWNPKRDDLTFLQDGPNSEEERPREFHVRLLKAFGEVGSLMFNRLIDEDGKWVRYEKDGTFCYWALENSSVVLDRPRAVHDLVLNRTQESPVLHMTRHHVYTAS